MSDCQMALLLAEYPSAPHNKKPSEPTRFHTPTCQPTANGFGHHHLGWTSIVRMRDEMTKPDPPITWAVETSKPNEGMESVGC